MKKRPFVPVVALLALAGCKKNDPTPDGAGGTAAGPAGQALAAVGALGDFEGEIGLLAKSAKERKPIPPITLTVKKAKLRFDVPEGLESGPRLGKQVHVVVNAPEKKLFAVVDEQKMVVVLDLEKAGEQFKNFKPPGAPAEPEHAQPPKVTKTGHMDTVAGYRCEDWDILSAKGERAKVCVSSEGTSWFQMPTIGLPSEQAWARELFDGHHLPLRFVGYDVTGAEDGRLEVTKLEKKAIADSVFEIPAGYRTMDMGEMMKGMMAGIMPPGMMPPGMMPPGMMPPGMMRPPGDPAAPGAGLPQAMQLPPNLKLPPGVQMPQNMQVPPNVAEMMRQMQERAKAAGIQTPPPPPPPPPH